MTRPASSAGLTITNPLTIYRHLVDSKKIRPDPAQHRLALQLQRLYYRLKDYNPEIEYRQRLNSISRSVDQASRRSQGTGDGRIVRRSLTSFWGGDGGRERAVLSLTRTQPVQESAMTIDSPQGMLLYGEVGRGKSMLLDLLANSLPSDKKRRWHFNTFMLDTFRRLEQLRVERSDTSSPISNLEPEHSILTLAREMVATSPILFLDEFQLPDRVASKLLSSFLTSFFHLGGVLIATSNRMPEELAKAAGVEFVPEPRSPMGKVGNFLRFGYRKNWEPPERAAATDFGKFLDVLRARCEIWEMEGEQDWRRERIVKEVEGPGESDGNALEGTTSEAGLSSSTDIEEGVLDSDAPPTYFVRISGPPDDIKTAESAWKRAVNVAANGFESLEIRWKPDSMRVYGRQVLVPEQTNGVTRWDFSTLCATNLGPADYITLASTYHTLILDNVPVLTTSLKNEARRFITLLDALYEARCRLLIRADAPPDHLFFPESKMSSKDGPNRSYLDSNEVYQETIAEIYQDATNPFRPNISIYNENDNNNNTPYAPTSSSNTTSYTSHPHRSVLADEDADFGPTYGNGRSHSQSNISTTDTDTSKRQEDHYSLHQSTTAGPDFTHTTLLTGTDERFAYKRARSRLWQLCSERWWDERQPSNVEEWWMPVDRAVRHWEEGSRSRPPDQQPLSPQVAQPRTNSPGSRYLDSEPDLYRNGATSPFRTRTDEPPKFGWVHSWGMMKWGKKAGVWGKGVDAKEDRGGGGGDVKGENDGNGKGKR